LSWIMLGFVIPEDGRSTGEKGERIFLFRSLLKLLKIRSAFGMLAFGFWISIANDSLFVVYGIWFEQDFNVSLVALGFSTVAIGLAELTGESMTALFADRVGLKRSLVFGLVMATVAYLLLPLAGQTITLAMAGLFCIFLFFEFTIVTSFSLSTELLPEARATMMAGFYATAGIGRMVGVLIGGLLWELGGILAVCSSAAVFTGLGLLSLLWGLHGWQNIQE